MSVVWTQISRRARSGLILSAAALGLSCAANGFQRDLDRRSFDPISIDTPRGQIVFTNLKLWGYSDVRNELIPWFSGEVQNRTGVAWGAIQFRVEIMCPGNVPHGYSEYLYGLGNGERRVVSAKVLDEIGIILPCESASVRILFVDGQDIDDVKQSWAREEVKPAWVKQHDFIDGKSANDEKRSLEISVGQTTKTDDKPTWFTKVPWKLGYVEDIAQTTGSRTGILTGDQYTTETWTYTIKTTEGTYVAREEITPGFMTGHPPLTRDVGKSFFVYREYPSREHQQRTARAIRSQ